jgi:HEPN domain-containing protein
MTNREAGQNLIKEAEEYLGEAERAFLRGSWNMVVRKSQEVVELSQKGMLKILGVEYPKVHDPSDFFLKVLEKRGIPINMADSTRVIRISAELSEKRAPAFYFEKNYGSADAKEAKVGAEFVLKIVKDILDKIPPVDNFQPS